MVIDTSALIAILNNEPERDRFLDILSNEDQPVLSAVTFYEAMLIASGRRGLGNIEDLDQILETIDAEIMPFDAEQALPPWRPTCGTGRASIRLPGSICAIASPMRWPSASPCPCSTRARISPRRTCYRLGDSEGMPAKADVPARACFSGVSPWVCGGAARRASEKLDGPW